MKSAAHVAASLLLFLTTAIASVAEATPAGVGLRSTHSSRLNASKSGAKRAAGKPSKAGKLSLRRRVAAVPAVSSKRTGAKKRVVTRRTITTTVTQTVVRGPYSYTAPWTVVPKMSLKETKKIRRGFAQGRAGKYTAQQLAKAGIFTRKPLWGGIFARTEPVQYIVMHSTETARAASAPQIIQSWNNRGLRHPGTPFMVDRDGQIYVTVDPNYGTVHIEPSRAQHGVTNSNSIGIEMVRSGKQKYTKNQLDSVVRLVTYLQNRYGVTNEHIYAHGYVQPSDRTDPVNFNWITFNNLKTGLSRQMVASANDGSDDADNVQAAAESNSDSSSEGAKPNDNGIKQYAWIKTSNSVPKKAPDLLTLRGKTTPSAVPALAPSIQ